jgi:hypothetical protein
MKALLTAAALACVYGSVLANEQEIQKALVQRDQQSAEFAARVRGADTSRLEQLHARQLQEITTQPLQPELRPYQRQKMADERTLVLPPPTVTLARRPGKPAAEPSPLPGRPAHVTDPIPAQGLLQ